MKRELVLRTRQLEGVAMFGDALRKWKSILKEQGKQRLPRIVFCAPTGFGKSVTFAHMARVAMEAGKRVAIICDRRVLVEQVSATLDAYGIEHAVIMAGSGRFHQHAKIHACSERTLAVKGSVPYDVILIDECHVLSKSLIKICENNPNALIGGFSATPTTKVCGLFFDDIICPATTNELVDEGLLIMPKIYCAHEIDMAGIKPKKNGEWDGEDTGKATIKIVGDIVQDYLDRSREMFGGPVKTVAFVGSIAAGEELAAQFAAVGLNFIAVSYKDQDDFKRDVFKEFEKPEDECSIDGLIAVDILTKGFDNVRVRAIILARPFAKSLEALIQQIGRVMRTSEGKLIAMCNDHAGNVIRFRERLLDFWENGVTELRRGKPEKAPKEKTPAEKKACQCPKCKAVWLGKTDTCVVCGFIRPKQSNIEVVPGKMEEVATRAATRETKQKWFSELLHIAAGKGYSEGWAAHKYREKFGVWPNSMAKTPAEPSPEVKSWLKSRMIAYSKAKSA